jgi:NAD(P)-dependent dehydrogenase (short-subunit alcohol dehydrogenase family)
MTAMSKTWQPADIPSLTGKRVLITGANSGIGYCASLVLARKGARILLACRDRERGQDALERLQSDSPGIEAEVVLLDLASLDSVRSVAADLVARKEPLHLLINNAGVYSPPRRLETADGFELQFGTNVLGHFALTGLLMPALELAAAQSESQGRPRVVTIASIAHKRGHLNFDDLQSAREYSPGKSYHQSKLANLLFAFELDRRLRAEHSSIMSLAAHPGVASTNLFRAGHSSAFEKSLRTLASHLIGILLNTDTEGALPTLYAATATDAEDGGYYGPQGWAEMRGHEVGLAKVAPQARRAADAQRLWDECEKLTGVRLL